MIRTNEAVTSGGLIYLCGVSGGAGDLGAQTRQVLEQFQATLSASNGSLGDILSVMVYLRSAGDFAGMNDVYRTFWPGDPPTRTTIVTDFSTPGALVEMSAVAVPPGGERRVIRPSTWIASPSPYSYAIASGDTVFLSGMVARNGRDNSVVNGDVRVQTAAIMDNAGELLAAAGLTHDHIVSARVYLTDGSTFQQMNEAYRPYFHGPPPARATVLTGLAGPQYSVEMTFIASTAARHAINAPATTNPNLSPVIRAGKRVYLSGVLGNTPATAGDVAAQTRETLSRIGEGLAAAGATPVDVVEATVYVTDLATAHLVDAEYRAFFDHDHPGRDHAARTTVRAGLVAPDGLVEIMTTAVTF